MRQFRFHGGIGNYYAERRLQEILSTLPLPHSPPPPLPSHHTPTGNFIFSLTSIASISMGAVSLWKWKQYSMLILLIHAAEVGTTHAVPSWTQCRVGRVLELMCGSCGIYMTVSIAGGEPRRRLSQSLAGHSILITKRLLRYELTSESMRQPVHSYRSSV